MSTSKAWRVLGVVTWYIRNAGGGDGGALADVGLNME